MGMWEVFASNDKAVKRNHLQIASHFSVLLSGAGLESLLAWLQAPGLTFDTPAHFQNVKFLCHAVFVFVQGSDDSGTDAEAPRDHR